MLFLKILACINKRTHQKQQQGNHRRGFLAAVFGVEMKGRIELPPVGLEPQLRYSWMQQMSASKDQKASQLYLRNYPVLPRCRCPSGPPTPSTTTCSRRFYAPNRLHLIHRLATIAIKIDYLTEFHFKLQKAINNQYDCIFWNK